jgi:hypothetical protein
MWSLAFFFPLFAAAASPGWNALLHFKGSSSHIEAGSSFFLSADGHENAEAELAATKELFARDPQGPCRFPARAIFLRVKPEGKGPLCDRWARWRETFGAQGIELVFASAFVNSPSSMYGHTLLKFPRGKEELLDYTLSFGAETGNAAGFAYVWLGLSGGFLGRYATAPFYLKVKEYNQVENRDFWVYPLKVSPKELELLVAHAWELRDVGFPYYFLKRNCAYYLLEFLEVARPGEGLTDHFPLWAVPMDTIRRLKENGWLAAEPRLRPSRRKVLEARKASLAEGEAGLVSALLEDPARPLPSGREAAVLDAAYDLWRYNTDGKRGDPETEAVLLARRAKFPALPPPVVREPPPETGHHTNRASLAFGSGDEAAFGEITYRGTLHDLLGNPLGYEPDSELSMGDIRFRWQKKIFLERLDLLRIRSLAPREPWFPSWAWSFRLGYGRAKEMRCRDWKCGHGILNGGGGMAWRLGPVHLFALAELDAELGSVFGPDYRFALGPSGGFYFSLWPGARALLEGDYRFRLAGEKRQKRSARLGLNQDLASEWDVRAEGAVNRGEREGLLRVGHYF